MLYIWVTFIGFECLFLQNRQYILIIHEVHLFNKQPVTFMWEWTTRKQIYFADGKQSSNSFKKIIDINLNVNR